MSENIVIEFLAVLIIFIASIIAVISAIGMIRFPDVYTRSHAATKSSTLAVLLTLTGVFIYFWITEQYFSVRLILGIIFVFLTSPVSGHLTTRSAYRSNVKLAEATIKDELGDAIRRRKRNESK